ncbi:MAG: hypothetical protein KFW07_04195 [Mycoplasmataceae bacterium]|nr:hypothetical protein [Mycoplasmataceae bacterium]
MKKTLLNLGVASLLVATPVIALVSCGTTSTKDTDLKITVKPSTQETIDKAIVALNKAEATEEEKLTSLNTVFTTVTSDNFKNFTVVAKATAGEVVGTITLKANSGFAFGEAKELVSKLLEVVAPTDLAITAKPVAQGVIDAAIAALKVGTPAAEQVTALSKVFNGVDINNLKNFAITATATAGEVVGTITLTAHEGFVFGDKATLSTVVA